MADPRRETAFKRSFDHFDGGLDQDMSDTEVTGEGSGSRRERNKRVRSDVPAGEPSDSPSSSNSGTMPSPIPSMLMDIEGPSTNLEQSSLMSSEDLMAPTLQESSSTSVDSGHPSIINQSSNISLSGSSSTHTQTDINSGAVLSDAISALRGDLHTSASNPMYISSDDDDEVWLSEPPGPRRGTLSQGRTSALPASSTLPSGFESTLQDPVAASQESLSPGHISIPSQGVSSGSGTSDFVVSSNADLLRGTDEDRLMSLQDYSFPRIFRQGGEPADAHEWGGLDADHRNDTPEVTADSMRNIANDREPPIVWPPGFAETISRVGSRLRDRGETEPFSRPAVAPTTRSVHATPTRVLSAQLSGIYQQLGRVGASLQALQANHLVSHPTVASQPLNSDPAVVSDRSISSASDPHQDLSRLLQRRRVAQAEYNTALLNLNRVQRDLEEYHVRRRASASTTRREDFVQNPFGPPFRATQHPVPSPYEGEEVSIAPSHHTPLRHTTNTQAPDPSALHRHRSYQLQLLQDASRRAAYPPAQTDRRPSNSPATRTPAQLEQSSWQDGFDVYSQSAHHNNPSSLRDPLTNVQGSIDNTSRRDGQPLTFSSDTISDGTSLRQNVTRQDRLSTTASENILEQDTPTSHSMAQFRHYNPALDDFSSPTWQEDPYLSDATLHLTPPYGNPGAFFDDVMAPRPAEGDQSASDAQPMLEGDRSHSANETLQAHLVTSSLAGNVRRSSISGDGTSWLPAPSHPQQYLSLPRRTRPRLAPLPPMPSLEPSPSTASMYNLRMRLNDLETQAERFQDRLRATNQNLDRTNGPHSLPSQNRARDVPTPPAREPLSRRATRLLNHMVSSERRMSPTEASNQQDRMAMTEQDAIFRLQRIQALQARRQSQAEALRNGARARLEATRSAASPSSSVPRVGSGFTEAMDTLRGDGLSATRHRHFADTYERGNSSMTGSATSSTIGDENGDSRTTWRYRNTVNWEDPSARAANRRDALNELRRLPRTRSRYDPVWVPGDDNAEESESNLQQLHSAVSQASFSDVSLGGAMLRARYPQEASIAQAAQLRAVHARANNFGRRIGPTGTRGAEEYEELMTMANALSNAQPRGTPAAIIASLPSGVHQDFQTTDSDPHCPICLEDYRSTDQILKLQECPHWLHKNCLEVWLKNANSCPICRKRVGPVQPVSSSSSGTTFRRLSNMMPRMMTRAPTILPAASSSGLMGHAPLTPRGEAIARRIVTWSGPDPATAEDRAMPERMLPSYSQNFGATLRPRVADEAAPTASSSSRPNAAHHNEPTPEVASPARSASDTPSRGTEDIDIFDELFNADSDSDDASSIQSRPPWRRSE